mgnify:FL=1
MEKESSSEHNYKYSLKDLATFISISFAILCFIIFIYWKGYADNLGININSMNIPYKENVYMIILTFISSVIIFTPSFLISKQFSTNVDTTEILVACIIIILNLFCSTYLFSPNLNLNNLLSLFVVYFILIIIVAILISTKPSLNNCPSIVLKLVIILILIFGLSSIYDLGKDSIKNQFIYSITKDNKYVVVYTTQDKYILNSVLIKDNKLIFTNKTQMIVDCNNVELTKQKFQNVEVRNP